VGILLVVRSSTTLFCGSKIAARWTAGLIVMNGEDLEAAKAKRLGFGDGKNLFFVHGVGVDLAD